ncbi:hypothetical protein BH09ACT11_BH09ACT11_22600 [soil metagenome]
MALAEPRSTRWTLAGGRGLLPTGSAGCPCRCEVAWRSAPAQSRCWCGAAGTCRPTPTRRRANGDGGRGRSDIRRGHCRRTRGTLLHQPSGEACPSGVEGFLEVAAEPGEWPDPCGIEVLGEPRSPAVAQCHRAAALDRALGQHLADHGQRHADPAAQREAVVAFEVADALLQGAHARRSVRVAHDCNPFRTRCHSVVVSRPSLRACLTASRRRSVSMRPRHSGMASGTGCASRPS